MESNMQESPEVVKRREKMLKSHQEFVQVLHYNRVCKFLEKFLKKYRKFYKNTEKFLNFFLIFFLNLFLFFSLFPYISKKK